MKKLIILGSSRGDGNTRKVVDHLTSSNDIDLIDLLDYTIGYYDYEYNNKDDDFLPLAKRIIENYDIIIFATPIYWYSMSAIMKTFFDRLSDLIRTEKDVGRKLRGKSLAMISCSGHDDRGPGFSEPFEMTAGYLGMKYLGDIHTVVEDEKGITPESIKRIDGFLK